MSEQLKLPDGDNCTDVSNIDEFYVRRINWLITVGRPDLIDEIVDDCECAETVRHAAGEVGTDQASRVTSTVTSSPTVLC